MKKDSTPRTLGAPDQPGHFMGVPTGLIVCGVIGAAAFAWLSSGSGEPTAPSTPAAAGSAGGSTVPTKTNTNTNSGSTLPAPTTKPTTPVSTVKPDRRPLQLKASPLLYVFVNSFGGLGIYDRLKNASNFLDGNGLDRIATLANQEFAGWATGREWTAPDTREVYMELRTDIDKIGFNYWIAKAQTQRVHAQAAQAGYGGAFNLTKMSATTQQLIKIFYFTHYRL